VVFGAAIRLHWNDVDPYSQADEATYLRYTAQLVQHGPAAYPQMVRSFLADPSAWLFPSPLRWGYLGITSAFSALTRTCSFRGLASVSTLAGILSVLFTWLVGRELMDPTSALTGAALAATSPLQLALGRRALADEVFCLVVLVSIWSLLRYFRAPRRPHLWLASWVLLTTLAFGVKEHFLIIYPVVILFWWLRSGRRMRARDLAAWALPPLMFAGVFMILARSLGAFAQTARAITSTIGASYAQQYQAGPPQRLIIDSIAIAPIVTLLAVLAVGLIMLRENESAGERHMALLFGGIFLVHALFSSQNIRYIVSADPFGRMLAGALLWRAVRERGWSVMTLSFVLAINGIIELALFEKVFLIEKVYDPTTYGVLRALEMLPR
jgi:4-amino-4-deoxy-L-arabinose transferase-like glycosyltransferase